MANKSQNSVQKGWLQRKKEQFRNNRLNKKMEYYSNLWDKKLRNMK